MLMLGLRFLKVTENYLITTEEDAELHSCFASHVAA